ncbi:MAG: carbon monoxide dehydrogenase subunit G [Candidatus Marsarchaeota archaeon]|jgi:carbon monoxide dehydrogenase subunit G|nr:carbon monoxide dehydrogenase subunit G [Candidatus Marsarchaeota archaeon]
MKFSGKAEIGMSQKKVFGLLNSPEAISKLIPGVQGFSKNGEEADMEVMVGLSFIRGKFKVKVKPVTMREPEYVELKGSGAGAGSSIDFLAKFNIRGINDKQSEILWDADVNVGGIAATFGSGMIKSAADKFISQIIEGLKKEAGES